MKLKRYYQVIKYGWIHSGQIANQHHLNRYRIFHDILRSYKKYHLWSNQYLNSQFWKLTPEEKIHIGNKYKKENDYRDYWIKDYADNFKFLNKYTNKKYEIAALHTARNNAYAKRYNAGENLYVEFNVIISRIHLLDGEIKIGNNVQIAKNVFIDYSGGVEIQNNVGFSNGVIIESHSHPGWIMKDQQKTVEKAPILIEDGVTVGSNSIILESCNVIGRYAKIGAGSVIRKSIPRYAIVVGNPAKIIGFFYSPQEMLEFEEHNYPKGQRTDVVAYTKLYEKYKKRLRKDIPEYLSLWVPQNN